MWNLSVADVVPGGLTDYKIQRTEIYLFILHIRGLQGNVYSFFRAPLFISEGKVVCSPGKEEL